MPRSSSSRVQKLFSRWFRPDTSTMEVNTCNVDSRKCEIFICHSPSLEVQNGIAKDLLLHLQKLNISTLCSRNCSIPNEEVINEATVCIVILTRDFANCTLCLEELRLMHQSKIHMIPIFYDVRPSEVRRTEKGVFRLAFEGAEKSMQKEEWKFFLQKTGYLSGWKFSDFRWNSRKLLKAVVQDAIKMVNANVLEVAKHPVGLAEKTEKLQRLLEVGREGRGARVLGLVGMGGIGKTTLAKEFFNIMRSQFKASCFVDDIKDRVVRAGLEKVQGFLLKDLLQIDNQIHSINQGKFLLRKCLVRAEVIIVLDNIDDFDQLDALQVPEVVHCTSIVLITTRDRRLVECIPNVLIYDMDGLEKHYAKELFCWHAFLMPQPALGFDVLVDKFVTYCNGLPLSLETLGAQVFGETIHIWERILQTIVEIIPGDIDRHLRVSYDALDWSEKQIFLDIASFFIGEDKDMAIRVWDALKWFGSAGVRSLQHKCLVKLEKNKFRMHDQLRDMAAKILEEENFNNPGCRSRLWRPNDVIKVLDEGSGSETVQGLTLVVNAVEDDGIHSFVVPKSKVIRKKGGHLPWSLSSFAPMTELQLLILEDACIEGDFSFLSRKLLCFRWRHSPSESFPVGLPVTNLHVLDMSGGKFSHLWSDIQEIPVQLQELNLRGFPSLEELELGNLRLPNMLGIGKYPANLQSVSISSCTNIKEFEIVGAFKSLRIKDCPGLRKIIASKFSTKLQTLYLGHCKHLVDVCSIENLHNLEYLNFEGCFDLESIENLEKLNKLTEFHLFLSDKYLVGGTNQEKKKVLMKGTDWLQKFIGNKQPQATHLSAEVNLLTSNLDIHPYFQQIFAHSSSEFKFRLPPTRSMMGTVMICFICQHSKSKNILIGPSGGMKSVLYRPIDLHLVNGANKNQISQYRVYDSGTFLHIGIFTEEYMVMEMLAEESELVLSAGSSDLIYGAWACLLPVSEKHLVGEIISRQINMLKVHKKNDKNYVEREEVEKKKLKDEVQDLMFDMDLHNVYALDIANFIVQRTYMLCNTSIYEEFLGPFSWLKRHQLFFPGINKLPHLNLQLSSSCLKLIEEPATDKYVINYWVCTPEKSTNFKFSKFEFPYEGSYANLLLLERLLKPSQASAGTS
ncbi:TMV resistance protein N isoform X3 [Amborella trichopoda]|uniref:TMV resistance protein N isoform X3 n=1 Tax=Amborella trichopoda TaxID=13333 RepID=UPI0009C169FC|nr:TMV resistance protein N isoform X3 [Amborella trichopoda]|eukprot:XP_020531000.1 TMV resistance protein N isoform X3 [Amborella trichopoda]